MNNTIKLLRVLFVLSLMALPLAGCTDDAMVLVLKVDAPKDGATVNTPTVTVSGRVAGTESTAAKVKINDTDVPVKDRKYSAEIALNEGQNTINIVATGGQAAPKEQRTVTYKR
jgi:hypothetical protein